MGPRNPQKYSLCCHVTAVAPCGLLRHVRKGPDLPRGQGHVERSAHGPCSPHSHPFTHASGRSGDCVIQRNVPHSVRAQILELCEVVRNLSGPETASLLLGTQNLPMKCAFTTSITREGAFLVLPSGWLVSCLVQAYNAVQSAPHKADIDPY